MENSEKIYYAKKKWDCSFEELAYLLDMEKTKVMDIYHMEEAKRLPKVTLDEDIKCLNLSNRTINALKRYSACHDHQFNTVKDLITYDGDFSRINGLGEQCVDEIREAIIAAQSVLNLRIWELIAAFGPGTNLNITWMNSLNSKSDLSIVAKRWEITGSKMTEVKSISGRTKGWLKTVDVNVWIA